MGMRLAEFSDSKNLDVIWYKSNADPEQLPKGLNQSVVFENLHHLRGFI